MAVRPCVPACRELSSKMSGFLAHGMAVGLRHFASDILPLMPSAKSNSRPRPFVPDDRQREAIEHVHGPMLVVAGAGTGKTSVLTHRIERLVREGHAYPHEILALTYTKNAANEMRDRLRKLLGGKEVNAATFHDYC